MKTAMATMAAVALAGLVAASAARAQTCVGDCHSEGMVSISDLVLGVNIALGSQPVTACPSFACQGGDTVPINCLIQGVNNALNDCMGAGPTPTPTPTTGGVTRNFTVDPGILSGPGESMCADSTNCIQNSDCSDNMCPASSTGLFTSALTNINAAAMFSSGPFKIVMGPEGANGVHPLSLAEDAVFFIDIVDSSCLCFKFKAAGSTGSIDCDGGTAYDTATSQPTGPGTAWTFETGLGSPSGPGNANLIVSGVFARVVDVCTNVHCENDSVYTDPPNTFPFTTTIATANKGTALTLSDHGAPFDCANFATTGSGGIFGAGIEQTIPPVGDTANVVRFAEKP